MPILIILLCLATPAKASAAGDWRYGDGYRDDLLYLHALINYDYEPDWYQNWGKELLKSNEIRMSFGSMTKSEFLHSEEVVINQSLGNGWWFRANYTAYLSRQCDTDLVSRYIGFQKKVMSNTFICASGDIRHNKEECDAAFGVLVAGEPRERYSLLEFAWDDLVYDDRNPLGGVTRKHPLGIQWQLRTGNDTWTLFSNGKVTTGFSRDYSDIGISPDFHHHEQQENHAETMFTWNFRKKSRLEFKISLYHFKETKLFTASENDYFYHDDIYHGALRYLFPYGGSNRVRLEVNTVQQYALARGYKRYHYRRSEYMPGIFLKRDFVKHALEIGYFSSVCRWKYDDSVESQDYRQKGYVDKFRLGWTYVFNLKSQLFLSVSHVLSINNFGGGNVQYMMVF